MLNPEHRTPDTVIKHLYRFSCIMLIIHVIVTALLTEIRSKLLAAIFQGLKVNYTNQS